MSKTVKKVRMGPNGTPWLPKKEYLAMKKKNPGQIKMKPPPVPKRIARNIGNPDTAEKQYVREAQVFENANAQTIINIPASFDPHAFQFMWLSIWTRMFEKSWNAMPPAFGDAYILDAFQIMQSVTGQMMGGATPEIRQLPIFVQTILNLVAPKNVKFRLNSIKYSWDSVFTPNTLSDITVSPANVDLSWIFGTPDVVTQELYTAQIIPFPPLTSSDPANLQRAFGLIENLANDTRLVDTGIIVSGKSDPSSFARTFAYLGSGNSNAGSAYGECEEETNFVQSWIPAQFCVFGNADTRASRSFRNKSGDSCLLTSLALIPGMRANDYRSGGPVIYKFIDFEEIYYWYVTWLTAAWSSALAIGGSPSPLLLTNLPMTVQTFRIILRQALLQCFSNQFAVQFMSPKPQNGVNDNVFVPFILNSGTYSQSLFGGMKFPLILAENMKMLKTVVLKIPKSKTKVVHIPVLGKWVNDAFLEDPQLNDNIAFEVFAGDTAQSIFLTSSGETSISLYDGTGGSPSVNFNMNGLYYQTALDRLNALVGILGNAGGKVDTVTGDAGPGLSLLDFTRYVQTANLGMLARKQRNYEVLLEHQERVVALKKSGSKKDLKQKEVPRPQDMHPGNMRKKVDEKTVNPVGSVNSNLTLSISSNRQLTQPLQALLKNFIIPNIRPDPNDSIQPQTASEWQIANIEPNLATYQTGGDVMASSFRGDDINEVAFAVITNILNGQNSSSLMEMFGELIRDSSGPIWGDILKGVLGVGMAAANVFL